MLKRLSFLILPIAFLNSCSQNTDTCSCWEELVTRAENQNISSSCEYILDMTLDEIHAEAGPDCVEKINHILFGDDDIEYEEELDENAMFEEVESFE
jgi:hypothetical protein